MLTATDRDTAKQTLLNDGVICYPTEAVWGIGCHPNSSKAFEKILRIKNRPDDKGVILIASTLAQLIPYIDIDTNTKQQLAAIWPGFITCLLPKSPSCPSYLSGKYDNLAVRLTTHPTVTELCQAINSPLVSTSANISGEAAIKDLNEAKRLFGTQIDYYVDAPLGGEAKPSRIIQLTEQQTVVIRE